MKPGVTRGQVLLLFYTVHIYYVSTNNTLSSRFVNGVTVIFLAYYFNDLLGKLKKVHSICSYA